MYRAERLIEVLHSVRKEISSGRSCGICAALGTVGQSEGRYIHANHIRTCVMKALKPHSWLDGWSRAKFGVRQSAPRLKAARLQWIDWMIARLEEDIIRREK